MLVILPIMLLIGSEGIMRCRKNTTVMPTKIVRIHTMILVRRNFDSRTVITSLSLSG